MNNNLCPVCERKVRCKNGICSVAGSDGFPVMCVGKWTEEKHHYIDSYLNIFFKAMAKKWHGNLYYIDLFCGPGRSRNRDSGIEIDGSPLIALKFGFCKYIFVDKNLDNIKSLKSRCLNRAGSNNSEFIHGDCNERIKEVINYIPGNSLSVTLVDPFGLNFNFESYIQLTKDRHMDLIIIFPLGMAIKRTMNKSEKAKQKVNLFLGGNEWRTLIRDKPVSAYGRTIIDYFKQNLTKIGYQIPKELSAGENIIVKNNSNIPLYHLLFVSKNQLGTSFWNKISQYKPNGQLSIFSP
jgi:three-Cys-motif partner protein